MISPGLLGIAVRGTVKKMEQYIEEVAEERWCYYKERERVYWSTGHAARKPSAPRDWDAWDAKTGNPYRFMAPYLDIQTRSAIWGLYCVGGHDEITGPDLYWRRKVTMEAFVDHMKQWGEITGGFHRQTLTN